MATILNYLGIGGFALVLLSVFFEITPIKLNPIQWLGRCLTKNLCDDIKRTEKKLDEHIAQSYRNKIMHFQNECIQTPPIRHTKEEFEEVLDACDNYEKYVKENNLKNGKCEEAMRFIKKVYRKCLQERDFTDISGN